MIYDADRRRAEEAREALNVGLQKVRLIQEQARLVPQLQSTITQLETQLLRYRYSAGFGRVSRRVLCLGVFQDPVTLHLPRSFFDFYTSSLFENSQVASEVAAAAQHKNTVFTLKDTKTQRCTGRYHRSTVNKASMLINLAKSGSNVTVTGVKKKTTKNIFKVNMILSLVWMGVRGRK